jgi:tetratricopeptide (TPR) repeat protein
VEREEKGRVMLRTPHPYGFATASESEPGEPMEDPGVWKLWVLGRFVLVLLVVLVGCAERRSPAKVADTPERHAGNGMNLLDSGDLDAAQAEFDQALALDAHWGPAYAGTGLVLGIKASRSQNAGEKGRLTRQAFENLRKAKRYAIGDDQKVEAYVAFIRVLTMVGQAGWLEDAEENLRYAVAVDRRAGAPYFFMGEAYKKAYRFGDAARMYRKVLDLDTDYKVDAERSQALIERIQQAAPGTTIGKQIALADALTRAQAAALFVQELKVEEVCARVEGRNSGSSQTSPAAGQRTEPVAKPAAAVDMGTNPLRPDVEAILPLGVRGLGLYPDQSFRPDELVTRAAFAVMLADILAKARGDDSWVSSFTGMSSPFVDVGNDRPYFGAVMACTSLGIMKPAGTGGNEFRPLETISGIEALLAVRTLKEYLKTG